MEEKGVSPDVARELASAYPYERVIDVVATMEYRKARGKCDNPGGFLREALVKQWQTPRPVVDARRRRAEAKLKQQAADEQARRRAGPRSRSRQQANAERRRKPARPAHPQGLDDEELAILGESVLKKYEEQLGGAPGADETAAAAVPADEDGDRGDVGEGRGGDEMVKSGRLCTKRQSY